ncbi:hypothetical protein DPEC_G00087720 [Dallia pectoralis]|uniref:Uncharacterized protein n=1 Tax=Dallia pectoralis TaxID=75939 RepID=A0ACC2H0Y8_DALPE|nr:hypothetical protein DPEC_G00087720 [Dallia pectoralis]
MAAVFLVMLYEYSPLFYISVITLCFVITAAMVLGWFGFDVPVILRSSDETESVLPVPEKRMVQVTNPFALEIGFSGATSVTEGISLHPCCLEPCVLSCYWGCSVYALQGALQIHQHSPRKLSTPQLFQEALHFQYHHCQTFHTDDELQEFHTKLPADLGITDFGLLPRERYPLVALLTLSEPEARNTYNIMASVNVLHVPDDKYNLSARILFQYLLTAQGNMYELKPLFMSAESRGLWGVTNSTPSTEVPAEPQESGTGMEEEEIPGTQDEDGEWSEEGKGRDCVVCQNAPVNRVLLPCRHACVCDGCVDRFQHCPICRAFVLESFTLSQQTDDVEEE